MLFSGSLVETTSAGQGLDGGHGLATRAGRCDVPTGKFVAICGRNPSPRESSDKSRIRGVAPASQLRY